MKRRLIWKFILAFLLLNIISCTSIYYIRMGMKDKIYNNAKKSLYDAAHSVTTEYINTYYSNPSSTSLINLRNQLQIVDTFIGARIWLVNKENIIILDTRNISAYSNLSSYHIDFSKQGFLSNVVIEGISDDPSLCVSYPVTSGTELKGYVVLLEPSTQLDASAESYTEFITQFILAIDSILLLMFLYLYRKTVIPVKKLSKATKEYTRGNHSTTFPVKSSFEFNDLSESISFMANELSKLDDYQKKFVANISHDFRSPLTSIKGYAEAILDGTIPYEVQDKYLNIILFETDRLTKLTSNLLTLNSFDNNKTLLDKSIFDINLIIKRTAETFEGICNQKKITLQLVFTKPQLMVEADMGKIQQVLYNLLDNAIKFSPQDSKIQISTEDRGEKVFVSVKDHGIGISKNSLGKVWERFYKTDESRGKDKKGTGLGLSITKEIINNHGENINVISTEGVGTEFIFTLSVPS